jgi:hypothetical protein
MDNYNQPAFDLKSLLPAFHPHTLPSAGFYSGTLPDINVRGLTVRELKHLTASGRFDKKIFDQTISSCIKENVDLSKLLLQDYNFIVYLVRLYTSGSKANGRKRCKNLNCGAEYSFEYDLTANAKITQLEDVLPISKSVTLPRFKESFGMEVVAEVKPLTRGDYLKIDKTIQQAADLAAKTGQPMTSYPLTELLKAFIMSISGLPGNIPKDQILDYLDPSEANLITSAYPDEVFGLSGNAVTTCPVCKTEQEFVIPFTDIFFQ